MDEKTKDILDLCLARDWEFLLYDDNQKMLSVVQNQNRINIYPTKMTIGVYLIEFKKQYFRKNCSMIMLEKTLINPVEMKTKLL